MSTQNKKFTNEQLQYIRSTYAMQGPMGTVAYIARHLKSSDYLVKRTLNELEIKLKPKEDCSAKFSADIGFFDTIDTEEKAYWLGFMYADGSIKKRNYVQLALIDEQPLRAFKAALKADHPITKEKNNRSHFNRRDDTLFFLRIGSSRLANALVEKGCLLKKADRVFPTARQVPNSLIRHFVRGFFDGDGTLYISTTKNKVYGAIAVHPLFGVGLLQHLQVELNIDLNMHKDKSIKGITMCYNKLKLFLDYIYKDCAVVLDRKMQFYDLINEGKITVV